MANSTRSRAGRRPAAEAKIETGSASSMSVARYSTWQVLGVSAGILALVGVACLSGVGLGYAWGRAAGRAASLPTMPMYQQEWMHPFQGMPGQPPAWNVPQQAGPAYLGITYAPLDPDEAEAQGLPSGEGARVVEVIPGGPADQGGVRIGDIVLAVDGERVRPPDRLRRMIQALQPGDEVTLELLRNGRELTVSVVLGSAE